MNVVVESAVLMFVGGSSNKVWNQTIIRNSQGLCVEVRSWGATGKTPQAKSYGTVDRPAKRADALKTRDEKLDKGYNGAQKSTSFATYREALHHIAKIVPTSHHDAAYTLLSDLVQQEVEAQKAAVTTQQQRVAQVDAALADMPALF